MTVPNFPVTSQNIPHISRLCRPPIHSVNIFWSTPGFKARLNYHCITNGKKMHSPRKKSNMLFPFRIIGVSLFLKAFLTQRGEKAEGLEAVIFLSWPFEFPVSSHSYFYKHFFSADLKIIAIKWQLLVNTLNANANNWLCGFLIFVKLVIYSEGSNIYPVDPNILKLTICITHIRHACAVIHSIFFNNFLHPQVLFVLTNTVNSLNTLNPMWLQIIRSNN